MTWEFEEVIIEKNPDLELIINNESWKVVILNFSKRNPCYQVCLRQKTLYINYVYVNKAKYSTWLNYHDYYRENYYG